MIQAAPAQRTVQHPRTEVCGLRRLQIVWCIYSLSLNRVQDALAICLREFWVVRRLILIPLLIFFEILVLIHLRQTCSVAGEFGP